VIHQRLHLFHPWQENSHDSTCSKVADGMPVMPSHWNLNEDLRVKEFNTKICWVKKIHDLGEITIKWPNDDKGFNHKCALCGHFDFFIKRIFWRILFYNTFFKIFIIPTINYIICVNSFWINRIFLKMYKIYQILHFILKNDHNFNSCSHDNYFKL
jgi:hypothetical protein